MSVISYIRDILNRLNGTYYDSIHPQNNLREVQFIGMIESPSASKERLRICTRELGDVMAESDKLRILRKKA